MAVARLKGQTDSDTFVESFAKGLAVIRAFGSDASTQTLSEVAKRTELTRAGARRLLHTLVTLGYASHVDGLFALTPRVLELGHAYLSSLSVREIAQPAVDSLASELGAVCSLSVLENDQVVYVARADLRGPLERGVGLGSRLPAFVTSPGRVLLASLDASEAERIVKGSKLEPFSRHTRTSVRELMRELASVRRQGYSLVSEELELGVCGIAVPVTDGTGRTIAAMSMSSNLARHSKNEMISRFLPRIRTAVARISAALRVTPSAVPSNSDLPRGVATRARAVRQRSR
jgi:IclR family pca regulon transcriptional regulator